MGVALSKGEVYQNVCVKHIAETRVHVEIRNLPTQFEEVLDEDGNPCAVRFDVGDYCGELVEVVSDQVDGLLGKVLISRGAQRSSRLDSSR